MVTKLQRMVEIIEDRHAGEKVTGRRGADSYRGSVLNATPREMHSLHSLTQHMNATDKYAHYRDGVTKRMRTMRKERLNGTLPKRQNA